MIQTSFEELWPSVVPGGIYIMNDLGVGWLEWHNDALYDGLSVSDVMKAWTGDLIMNSVCSKDPNSEPNMKLLQERCATKANPHVPALPHDIDYIHCEESSCTIGKKWPGRDANRWDPGVA